MRGTKPRWAKIRLLLFLAGSILMFEGALRVLHVSDRLLLQLLYFQSADMSVHERSPDTFLHYELKPDSHFHGEELSLTAASKSFDVNIDEFGARRPSHPAAKSPGTFRVLAFGGSTLYGARVNDDETIAARMEARLNGGEEGKRDATHFEVWNFGTSAYTLSQAAHRARRKSSVLNADLILVQVYNTGRRAFLAESTDANDYLEEYLHFAPDFRSEQYPRPPWLSEAFHEFAFDRSAIYQAGYAVVRRNQATTDGVCEYCARLDRNEALILSLEAAERGIPVVFVAIPAARGRSWTSADSIYPRLPANRFINLYRPGRDDSFYLVHPPAVYLDEYAGMIIEGLNKIGLLSRPPVSSAPVGAAGLR